MLTYRFPVLGIVASGVVLGCVFASPGRSPVMKGDGTLRQVDIPRDRGTNRSVATPRFVVFDTTGPNPILLCTNRRLAKVTTAESCRLLAASRAKDVVLCGERLSFALRACPSLEEQDRFELKTFEERQIFGGFVLSFCLLPYQTGWVHVARQGQVARIESDPLRIGLAGKAATEHVLTAAVDEETGTLVLIDPDKKAVVLFDLKRMETTHTVRLDCDRVGGHVRAANGTAWISTNNGMFFGLNVTSGRVTGRTELSRDEGDNSVTLDLSPSGRLLAACSSRFVKGGDRPTILRVFRVKEGQLKEVASAQANLPHSPNAITILEEEQMVILNSQHPVFAWHYGAKGAEQR